MFTFTPLNAAEIEKVLTLQDEAFSTITSESILRKNSRDMFLTCFNAPHYTLGVKHNETLVALGILYAGQLTEENLGNDLNLSENSLLKNANIKLIIVSPTWRGFKLQHHIVKRLETVAKKRGFETLSTTVHPQNEVSIRNFEAMGYDFKKKVTKYGGLLRNLYFKELY